VSTALWILVALGAPAGTRLPRVDLAAEAAAVLRARCFPCHGPDSTERKAVRAWRNALDVAGTIEEGLLEPGDPDNSELWELVVEGDMPPDDSESGPLTEDERALLRRWIEAGAPAAEAGAGEARPAAQDGPPDGAGEEPDAVPDAGPDEAEEAEAKGAGAAFAWTELGVLHPLLVHFPIALLLAAVGSEILVGLGAKKLRATSRFCAFLGLLGSVAAGAAGWLLAETQRAQDVVETHRWLAVATGACALLFVLSLEAQSRGRGSRFLHVLFVVATALLVTLTGHWGGMTSYGEGYLDELAARLTAWVR